MQVRDRGDHPGTKGGGWRQLTGMRGHRQTIGRTPCTGPLERLPPIQRRTIASGAFAGANKDRSSYQTVLALRGLTDAQMVVD